MSDLKTELTKVMNEWEKPMNTPTQVETKEQGYAERVFNFLRGKSNSTLDDVKKAIPQGDTQSTASALRNLYDRGLVGRTEVPVKNYPGYGRKTQYAYFTVTDKYETVNKGYWKPKNKPEKEKTKPVKVTQSAHVTPREKIVTHKPEFNAEQFIENLSVTQAKAVYLALKAIFESRLHG